MKVRPSHTCCGCVSLLIGVEFICLLTLLSLICVLSIVSSKGTLTIGTFHISPTLQVAMGSWAFVGIPIVIAAGVAALYRIEVPLRIFFLYLIVSFFFGIGVPIWFLTSGSLCDQVVSREVQRMGSSFVCGFTDSLTLFWTLIIGTMHAYVIYIVWSAAEEIAEAPYAELMKYSDALKQVYVPDAPPDMQYTTGRPRAAALANPEGMMNPGMLGRSYGGVQGMGMPPTAGMAPGQMGMNYGTTGGMPQSFVPQPGSGFR